jgi:hypothetical protein
MVIRIGGAPNADSALSAVAVADPAAAPRSSRSAPPGRPCFDASGAPEDGLAFLGEGVQAFEIVAAVVSLPAQPLDAFVYLRRDGLVVRKDSGLGTDAGEPVAALSVPVAAAGA